MVVLKHIWWMGVPIQMHCWLSWGYRSIIPVNEKPFSVKAGVPNDIWSMYITVKQWFWIGMHNLNSQST